MTGSDSASRRCDVTIVGAGITGLSVAFELLSRRDRRLLVVDREGVAAGASGVQPRGVRQQWGSRAHCLLARESLHAYRGIGERLQSTARPVFESCGYMFVAHSDARLQQLAADVEIQNRAGVPSQILSAEQAGAELPDLRTDTVVGAAWCAEDGYFDRPQAVVAAYGAAVERLGATIAVNDVARLEPAAGSWRIVLTDGSTIDTGTIVVAAGYAARTLLQPLGIGLPIVKEPRYLSLSHPIRERLLEPLVVSAERSFAAKQLADGRVLASYTAAHGDPAACAPAWRHAIRERIEELLPRLEYVSFPILVEGFYDTTPDHQPIIDELLDGLWLAAGFSGHGFMLAPAVARRLAAAIDRERIDDLLDGFSLARLARPLASSEAEWVV